MMFRSGDRSAPTHRKFSGHMAFTLHSPRTHPAITLQSPYHDPYTSRDYFHVR